MSRPFSKVAHARACATWKNVNDYGPSTSWKFEGIALRHTEKEKTKKNTMDKINYCQLGEKVVYTCKIFGKHGMSCALKVNVT